MKILLLIPLLGVVYSAPVAEDNIEKSPIVKRAMETIMFGNQQNLNKPVKKSDPSVPLRDDIPDVKAPVLPDKGGVVEAEQPKDLPVHESDENTKSNEQNNEQNGSEEHMSISTDEGSQNSGEQGSTEQSEEPEISKEDQDAINELQNSVNNDNGLSNDQSSEQGMQNYDNYDLLALYKEYENMLSQSPKYNYYYNNYRRKRRGAIRKRKFLGKFRGRPVKRAHRTKRDLTYPDESDLYDPYYYPELTYNYPELNGYGYQYEMENNPLEDILQENELPYGLEQYEEPTVYDYRPLTYEEEEEPFFPAKRQSMLSFVPGNRKRSSYFYPASEEPQTHFGAFIPDKRDYFSTYGSLVRAARLLAAKEEERNALQGYDSWY